MDSHSQDATATAYLLLSDTSTSPLLFLLFKWDAHKFHQTTAINLSWSAVLSIKLRVFQWLIRNNLFNNGEENYLYVNSSRYKRVTAWNVTEHCTVFTLKLILCVEHDQWWRWWILSRLADHIIQPLPKDSCQ